MWAEIFVRCVHCYIPALRTLPRPRKMLSKYSLNELIDEWRLIGLIRTHRENYPMVTSDPAFSLQFVNHSFRWSHLKCKRLSFGHKRVILASFSFYRHLVLRPFTLFFPRPQKENLRQGRVYSQSKHTVFSSARTLPSEIQLKPTSIKISKGEKVTRK